MPNNGKTSKQHPSKISRRAFVGTSAAAAAAFSIVPRSVLGQAGENAPSQKINLAFIGVGDKGMGNLQSLIRQDNVQGVAAADVAKIVEYTKQGHPTAGLDIAIARVDEKNAERSGTGSYKGCNGYVDFREMMDKEESIDAVVVSTPDHVHASACLAAISRGKHVYCEKPLTHSIYETRVVTEAARSAGVITQMGNAGHSGEGIRLAVEWIRDGAIGPIREIHGCTGSGASSWITMNARPPETPPVPDGLDWDLWLGPADERPYHPVYLPYDWRAWWDFGTGGLGDMACHNLDPAFWALDLGFPTSVESTATGMTDETVPIGAIHRWEFPARGDMPEVSMTWYDGEERPPRPPGLEEDRRYRGGNGIYFVGDNGTITMQGWAESPRLVPETAMKAYEQPEQTIPRLDGHHKGWIDSIKSGEQVHGGFDYSGNMTEAILLGNVALRTGKKIIWDGPNMKAEGVPEADQFIKPPMREGWRV